MADSTGMPKFLAVDFYCGAGGTTRGLLDAGGYVIAGIDKDEDCRATYERNNRNAALDGEPPAFLPLDLFPNSPDYPQGRQHEALDDLRRRIPRYQRMAPDAPLLFAVCAPCQSFTRFVQRKMTPERANGRDRDRNLLAQATTFITEFRPEMVISENVANINNAQYGQVWDDFQEALRGLEYAVGASSVCASRFGVPQRRRRSVIIAFKSKTDAMAALDPVVPLNDPVAREVSASEAIGHLPSLEAGEKDPTSTNHECRNLADVNRRRLESVRPGEPNFGFADSRFGDLSLPCHGRLKAKGTLGFGDVYTRMRSDRPSPTITTRFHSISNGRFGHYDESQVRGLSLREGAALQSFPDDYEFYGKGMDAVARMIGNAVPPKLSAYMAKHLLGVWRETNDSVADRAGA